MNWSEDFRSYSEGYGFMVPFALLIISISMLIKTPSFDELAIFTGVIEPNRYFEGIQLENEKIKFSYNLKADKEKAYSKLKNARHAKIWVKNNDSNRKIIKQLELDGDNIFEYNYWREIIVYIVFAVVGAILIPVVIKAKRKQLIKRKENENL